MKKILVLILFLMSINSVFAHNYSTESINIYNSAVALQKQGKYELAEEKYMLALKIQPNFIEAKKNLSILYYNQSIKYLSQDNFNGSIKYANTAIAYGYNKTECYHVMANVYKESEDYVNLISVCEKLNILTPNDDNVLNYLALAYLKSGQTEKAQNVYKKILLIIPNDRVAKQNLEYINYKKNDEFLSRSLNNIQVAEHAPKKIYKLIKRNRKIPKSYVLSTQRILDLVWSGPDGRKMLLALRQNKIPIRLLTNDKKAETLHNTQVTTTYTYGMVPVNTFTSYSTTVVIPLKHIDEFNNPNLDSRTRIYNLQAFLHEFGHAYMFIIDPNNKNSLQEEMGVSMLGYNIANKIITGEYLTREQTQRYSQDCLISLLGDDHRNLPVFSTFNRKLRLQGIYLPYPEEYIDLPVMYKKLLDEGKVSPAPTFFTYMKNINN